MKKKQKRELSVDFLKNSEKFQRLLLAIWPWVMKSGACLVMAVKGFRQDRCILRASALTYYTLLSIVPVLAMAFGIAKGFGFQKLLENELLSRSAGQEQAVEKIIDFSMGLLTETKGGIVAAVGVLFLLWSVIKTFSQIEDSFNAIWFIKRGRSLIRKFTDYLALFFTAPMLLIFSGSTTVFIKSYLRAIIPPTDANAFLLTITSLLIKLLPYCTIWILFTFLYVFMPNKKVDIKAAFTGGVIAGTIYQTAQVLYISSQVGVSQINAIYGSFAALPLFLIWLQASWMVLLLGAELVFAFENYDGHDKDGMNDSLISQRLKKLMALRITLHCVRKFARGEAPPSDLELSGYLEIPIRIVRSLIGDLISCSVLSEVNTPSGPRYQPARDLDSLSILSVINALEEDGRDDVVSVPGTLEYEALEEALRTFSIVASQSPGERLIKDI